MKIAHLTSVHGAFDTRIFHKQCKSLARAGYDVHLVVVHDKDELRDGVSIKALHRMHGRFNRMIKTVWNTYRAACAIDADIYHLHDPELIPVGLALKWRNKIVIFDSHEDYPADIMSKGWIPIRIRKHVSRAFAALEKYAFPKFDAVVTVHEQIARRIGQFQPKIVTVHNFPVLDPAFIVASPRIPRFVWLGMLSPIRGSAQIDAALKLLDGAALDVIGPVSNLAPDNKEITILGTFPQAEAMQMASQYLAGLVTYLPEPNHVDALPNKLFEYMALGLPVIASNFPKWKLIIEDAGCGLLVDPTSPNDIAKALQWILDNKRKAIEMGLRGRATVLVKYSWISEEKVLLDLYKGFDK